MVTPPPYFEAYPSVEALAQASPEEVFPYIKSVSYPNNKAKHLVGMARKVVSDFGGTIPQEVDELQKLRGRPQDSQRGSFGSLQQGGDGCRYARLPGIEPYRAHPSLKNTTRNRAAHW